VKADFSVFMHVLCLFLFCSCGSTKKRERTRSQSSVSIKYIDVPLEKVDAGGWVGGTRSYPLCLTAGGARILTPVKGLVMPRIKRSIDSNGRVVYPDMGYLLIGDVKVMHYRMLIKRIESSQIVAAKDRPIKVFVDSNRLEKGALLQTLEGIEIASFVYESSNWVLKR
jgi:hypothetical protein